MTMKLQGAAQNIVGSDIEWPEFDPWGFTKDIAEEKINWSVTSWPSCYISFNAHILLVIFYTGIALPS
jgi:hypothetical protein